MPRRAYMYLIQNSGPNWGAYASWYPDAASRGFYNTQYPICLMLGCTWSTIHRSFLPSLCTEFRELFVDVAWRYCNNEREVCAYNAECFCGGKQIVPSTTEPRMGEHTRAGQRKAVNEMGDEATAPAILNCKRCGKVKPPHQLYCVHA